VDKITVETEKLRSIAGVPDHGSGKHHGTDGVKAEFERRHNTEIAAAASQCPEHVCVLARGRTQHVAIGGHDAGGEEVVHREPMFPHQPTNAAA
jgi:hypothetical protein